MKKVPIKKSQPKANPKAATCSKKAPKRPKAQKNNKKPVRKKGQSNSKEEKDKPADIGIGGRLRRRKSGCFEAELKPEEAAQNNGNRGAKPANIRPSPKGGRRTSQENVESVKNPRKPAARKADNSQKRGVKATGGRGKKNTGPGKKTALGVDALLSPQLSKSSHTVGNNEEPCLQESTSQSLNYSKSSNDSGLTCEMMNKASSEESIHQVDDYTSMGEEETSPKDVSNILLSIFHKIPGKNDSKLSFENRACPLKKGNYKDDYVNDWMKYSPTVVLEKLTDHSVSPSINVLENKTSSTKYELSVKLERESKSPSPLKLKKKSDEYSKTGYINEKSILSNKPIPEIKASSSPKIKKEPEASPCGKRKGVKKHSKEMDEEARVSNQTSKNGVKTDAKLKRRSCSGNTNEAINNADVSKRKKRLSLEPGFGKSTVSSLTDVEESLLVDPPECAPNSDLPISGALNVSGTPEKRELKAIDEVIYISDDSDDKIINQLSGDSACVKSEPSPQDSINNRCVTNVDTLDASDEEQVMNKRKFKKRKRIRIISSSDESDSDEVRPKTASSKGDSLKKRTSKFSTHNFLAKKKSEAHLFQKNTETVNTVFDSIQNASPGNNLPHVEPDIISSCKPDFIASSNVSVTNLTSSPRNNCENVNSPEKNNFQERDDQQCLKSDCLEKVVEEIDEFINSSERSSFDSRNTLIKSPILKPNNRDNNNLPSGQIALSESGCVEASVKEVTGFEDNHSKDIKSKEVGSISKLNKSISNSVKISPSKQSEKETSKKSKKSSFPNIISLKADKKSSSNKTEKSDDKSRKERSDSKREKNRDKSRGHSGKKEKVCSASDVNSNQNDKVEKKLADHSDKRVPGDQCDKKKIEKSGDGSNKKPYFRCLKKSKQSSSNDSKHPSLSVQSESAKERKADPAVTPQDLDSSKAKSIVHGQTPSAFEELSPEAILPGSNNSSASSILDPKRNAKESPTENKSCIDPPELGKQKGHGNCNVKKSSPMVPSNPSDVHKSSYFNNPLKSNIRLENTPQRSPLEYQSLHSTTINLGKQMNHYKKEIENTKDGNVLNSLGSPALGNKKKIDIKSSELQFICRYKKTSLFGGDSSQDNHVPRFDEVHAFVLNTEVIDGCQMFTFPDKEYRRLVSTAMLGTNNFATKMNDSEGLRGYCTKLLYFNKCELAGSCSSDHMFSDSMWTDLSNSAKWWDQVEKLLRKCDLISCDVFISICSNLYKMNHRHKLLFLSGYLVERKTDSPDYLQQAWSAVLYALEQTGVQKMAAIQSILQCVCSRQPSPHIEVWQDILKYLAVENESATNIWKIYESLKHFKEHEFLLSRLFNATLLDILKNPFCKPDVNLVKSLIIEMTHSQSSFNRVDTSLVRRLVDVLSRNHMIDQELAFHLNDLNKLMSPMKSLTFPQSSDTGASALTKNDVPIPSETTQRISHLKKIESEVSTCLVKHEYIKLLFKVKEWSQNFEIVPLVSKLLLDHIRKSDEDWFLVLQNIFSSCNEKNGSQSVLKLLDWVATSCMSDMIKIEKWKSAFNIYKLMRTSRLQLPGGVFVDQGMSQVRRVILCCELCYNVNEFDTAASLLLDNSLHLDEKFWTLESRMEDGPIVRRCIRFLLQKLISGSSNKCINLAVQLLKTIMDGQKSITTPIDVSPVCEDLIFKWTDMNNCDKAHNFFLFLTKYHDPSNFPFSKSFQRVVLISAVRAGKPTDIAFHFSRSIYPFPKVIDSLIEVYSFWRREEMKVYLEIWFNEYARYLRERNIHLAKCPVVYIQIKKFIFCDEKRSTSPLPQILGEPDPSIRDARRRLQNMMTNLNPPLLVNFSDNNGFIELDHLSVEEMLETTLKRLNFAA